MTATPVRPAASSTLLPVTVLIAITAGALTAQGQSALPDALRSVANSAGSWSLLAFALALRAPDAVRATAAASVALVGLLAGYIMLDEARGFPASHRLILFWLIASIIAGPALGLGAHLLRRGTPVQAVFATGVLCGVLLGEGIYGLTVIADTTSGIYWTLEITIAVLVFVFAAGRYLRRCSGIALAVGVTGVVAAAFLLIY